MGIIDRGAFGRPQPADRWFWPGIVAWMWCGLLMGFVPEMLENAATPDHHYPIAVHVHAAVFVGWMALLSTQVLLVRSGRIALHRRLGQLGAVMTPLMPVAGLWAAWTVDTARIAAGKSGAFLAIQSVSLIIFLPLMTCALASRRDAGTHRRLVLLATAPLVDAGFSRWWHPALRGLIGDDFFGKLLGYAAGSATIILAIALYDLATRRRIHPVWVGAVIFYAIAETCSVWALTSDWWPPVARTLLGM